MKTPREILLTRHQSANPKLDKLRAEALSTVRSNPSHAPRPPVGREMALPVRAVLTVWRELIWPCRKTWAGIAVAWLMIIPLNFLILDKSETTRPGSGSASLDIRTFFAEQNRLIAELGETMPPSPPPPPAASRPRSEYRVTNRAHC
jgi:hypothetical protein